MPIPVWVLLAFAGWTIALLLGSVGVYRWSHIVTGRREIKSFRADDVTGDDWYKRAMRAHANCIENLPIYGAIVLAIVVADLQSPLLDTLAVVLIGARVIHSIIHVAFQQTNLVASFRFTFFFIQLVCMVWMGINAGIQVA
jgi:uncharacterized MAPEG superfamily protein